MSLIESIDVTPNWAEKFESFPDALKIKDGESKTFTFMNNGNEHRDQKNKKDDIVFTVKCEGVLYSWYVNAKSFSTIADIKSLGFPLIGKTITLSRTGSGRHDTRYMITLNKS